MQEYSSAGKEAGLASHEEHSHGNEGARAFHGDDSSNKLVWTVRTSIAFGSLCLLYVGSQLPLYFIGGSLSFVAADLQEVNRVSWIPVANTLALAAVAPFSGYLQDLLGRRYISLLGGLILMVGVTVTGTAHTFTQCAAGMGITGAGCAIGELTALAGVSEIVPVDKRGIALAVVTAFLLPFTPYVMYCEYWSTYSTWRWGMWVSLILNGVAFIGIALTYFPKSALVAGARTEVLSRIDYIGGGLSIIGLTLFLVALQSGGYTHPWTSAYVLATLLVGIACIIGFILWEWKGAKYPMVPREIFQGQRIVALAFLIAFVSGMDFYSILNFFPLTYTALYEPVPLQIGLKGLGQGLGSVAGAVGMNALLSVFKNHNREILLTSCVIMTVFGGAAASLTPFTPKWAAACATIACFGVGGVLVPAATIAITVCPDQFIATTVALSLSIRVVGGSIGYTIYYNIFASKLKEKLPAYIAERAAQAGLPVTSLEPFVGAFLLAPTTLSKVPGVTPAIIEAAKLGSRWAYSDSLKYVWYTSIPFGVLACVACLFLGNVRPYLTRRVAVELAHSH